jgi:hypothetical protein
MKVLQTNLGKFQIAIRITRHMPPLADEINNVSFLSSAKAQTRCSEASSCANCVGTRTECLCKRRSRLLFIECSRVSSAHQTTQRLFTLELGLIQRPVRSKTADTVGSSFPALPETASLGSPTSSARGWQHRLGEHNAKEN